MKKSENIIVFANTVEEARELTKYYDVIYPPMANCFYRFHSDGNYGFIREAQGGYSEAWENYKRLSFDEWKEQLRKEFILTIDTYIVYAETHTQARELVKAQRKQFGERILSFPQAGYFYRFSPHHPTDKFGRGQEINTYIITEDPNPKIFYEVQAKLTFEEWEWMLNNKNITLTIPENQANMKIDCVSVSGCPSLLEAFEKELIKMGRKRYECNTLGSSEATHLCVHDNKTYSFLNYDVTGANTAYFSLPAEWELALKIASDVGKEEEIEILGYTADFSEDGKVKFGCQEFTTSQVVVINDVLSVNLLTKEVLAKIIKRLKNV